MICYGSQGRLAGKIHQFRQQFADNDPQAIRQLLPARQVQKAVEEEKVAFRFCLFTPLVTLWTFLGQMLSTDGSCREAVARLAAFMGADAARRTQDNSFNDPETGPYCKARQRLPERVVSRLARETGRELHRRHPAGEILGGRIVKVVDGTTCSMPDTAENQVRWPQPSTQKPGLGFPLMRLVALMSLNCAAVLDVVMGPYQGKETERPHCFARCWTAWKRGMSCLPIAITPRTG